MTVSVSEPYKASPNSVGQMISMRGVGGSTNIGISSTPTTFADLPSDGVGYRGYVEQNPNTAVTTGHRFIRDPNPISGV
jgi:hypothetical protein